MIQLLLHLLSLNHETNDHQNLSKVSSFSQSSQIDNKLLENLKKCLKKNQILEKSKSWKYSQQWNWFKKNPEQLSEISDLFDAINQLLLQGGSQELELIENVVPEYSPGLVPKYRQARIFGDFLRIAYFPSHVLGNDYDSISWKSSLYVQALQLIELIHSLSESVSQDSLNKTQETCKIFHEIWKNLVFSYFQELFKQENNWNPVPSAYLVDEYDMTPTELEAAQRYSLSLEQEMSSDSYADIILIAAGSAFRADQQYPLYIQKLALAHPDKKIKIFMIDPFFIKKHPKSITKDWQAIDYEGKEVAYSNHFIKDNVEAIVCREGFNCSEHEYTVIKSYLSKALEQGSRVFLGNHCSNVSSYLPPLFNQLKCQYSTTNQLVLYSEDGQGIVNVWKENLYNVETWDLLEEVFKSKLKLKSNIKTRLKKLGKFNDDEIEKIAADYRLGSFYLGYELSFTMDDLMF